nr:ATP synthase subunit 8 [Paecilomyces variotii]UYI31786.1 ATP synthase subunit 8 [Paecilomyces variotii]
MPQLNPLFFVNQIVFAFVFLSVLIYTFSKYILPKFVRVFISRIYINKL